MDNGGPVVLGADLEYITLRVVAKHAAPRFLGPPL